MFLVMICAVIVLLAQNITETDEIKNLKNNCSTKHSPSVLCEEDGQKLFPNLLQQLKIVDEAEVSFRIQIINIKSEFVPLKCKNVF